MQVGEYIGDYAFEYNLISSLELGENITYLSGFGVNQLINVTIPDNVTTIANWAFYDNDLTSIAIPNSVQIIGLEAFRYNNIIQGNATINNHAANVSVGTSAFANNGASKNTTIIPRFLLDE